MLKAKEVFFLSIYIFFTLIGLTLIKMGAQGDGKEIYQIIGFRLTPKLIIGVLCYGISFLLYIVVISQMQISLVIPIAAAINSIGTIIIGLSVFHERLVTGQMVGILIVIIGTLVIGIFGR